MKKISIIGLGYVGLPLAGLCAKKGYEVIGLERNTEVVALLKNGKSHFQDHTVKRLLSEAHATGRFHLTTELSELSNCEAYLICVPTPVDKNFDPDLTPLLGAARDISRYLNRGNLVVVESTVFPGTCEDLVLPILEEGSGLKVSEDIHFAHCPERINPGDAFWSSENIPRVVGATSQQGVRIAAEFYSSILGGEILDVRTVRERLRPKFKLTGDDYEESHIPFGSIIMMRSIRDAEAVKIMENTVRDVNIAFVNELAKISDVLCVDVIDVIDGMSTKPFGKGPFFPGVGVGGHCIAVDPEWLRAASTKAGYIPELMQLARNTNNSMPEYTINLLQDALNDCSYSIKGTTIAVLGVAYKKNVDDDRESPFFEIFKQLQEKGAQIRVYDSWIKSKSTVDSLEQALQCAQAVVIVTDHDNYVSQMKEMNLAQYGIKVIIDGRNCLESQSISSQGIIYRGIGRR